MSARAKDLFETSVDQVRRGQVRAALSTLLDALAVDPLHRPSLEAAGNICRVLGSSDDASRFEGLAQAEVGPEQLFEMGWHLVDQGRPDVAEAYLAGALHAVDDPAREAPIRRELAYSQLQQRHFERCLGTLAPLSRHDDLAESELLDIDLLSAEAALYAGRVPLCRASLQRAEERVPDDIQRGRIDALHALLGRAAHWDGQLARAGLREWHFIQHAGVLLKTAGGYFEDGSRGGRFDLLDLREDMVCFLLRRLGHLLERLALVPGFIVPASALSTPLAHGLAACLGARVAARVGERGEQRTLLLAASAAELTPLADELADHHGRLDVAALALDWSRDAAVCPDIAGVLARRVFLPWEPRRELEPESGESRPIQADPRDPEQIGRELWRGMAKLPDDDGASRRSFEGFYLPLAAELVLGNALLHPVRRQFTHLSPAWKPTGPESMRGDSGDGQDT